MSLPDLTGLYGRAAMMRQQEEEQQAQLTQAAQLHELRLEDARFRNRVIRPLEVREAELDLESRQQRAALLGMEAEAEMAKQRNYQRSLEVATGLRQSFSSLPVNERYWKSKDFTDAAKTHFGISPNEETKRLYMDFAAQEIHYQLLDELPGIPSSMPDDGSLAMAEPGSMEAKPTYRNRIEKLEAVKNRFFDLPELHDEIDGEIQREKARPQYWASDMDLLAPFIPETMRGIVAAAKDGRDIPPQVRTMVERAAQYQLEQSLKEPERQIKPQARPISDTVKLKYLEATPEQKEKMRAFWPELASSGLPESGPVINNPTTPAPAKPVDPMGEDKSKVIPKNTPSRAVDKVPAKPTKAGKYQIEILE